jgi:carotenoid cleavage dioxygenase-like enzyme
MTENLIILTETPLIVKPLEFLSSRRPFIENYRWEPDLGTRFLVFQKSDGELVGSYETEAFFTFHHINAFEFGDDILIDISAYPEPSIIDELYLEHMRQSDRRHIPVIEVRRYCLPSQNSRASYDVILDGAFELPGINYRENNSREYRFAYGLGLRNANPLDFLNQLIKLDVEDGHLQVWHQDGCYPGEPIFVSNPDEQGEDEGVILSIVLDIKEHTSFLVILDAASFKEIARAIVPHQLPFGFHGQFFGDVLQTSAVGTKS